MYSPFLQRTTRWFLIILRRINNLKTCLSLSRHCCLIHPLTSTRSLKQILLIQRFLLSIQKRMRKKIALLLTVEKTAVLIAGGVINRTKLRSI